MKLNFISHSRILFCTETYMQTLTFIKSAVFITKFTENLLNV